MQSGFSRAVESILHICFLVYFEKDQALSGVKGLMSMLKPEQHNLSLQFCNPSVYRERDKEKQSLVLLLIVIHIGIVLLKYIKLYQIK